MKTRLVSCQIEVNQSRCGVQDHQVGSVPALAHGSRAGSQPLYFVMEAYKLCIILC